MMVPVPVVAEAEAEAKAELVELVALEEAEALGFMVLQQLLVTI